LAGLRFAGRTLAPPGRPFYPPSAGGDRSGGNADGIALGRGGPALPGGQERQRRHLAKQPGGDQSRVQHQHPPVAEAVLEDRVGNLGIHPPAVCGEERLPPGVGQGTARRGTQEVALRQLATVEPGLFTIPVLIA